MSDSAKDGANGIRSLLNPARNLRRREEEAGLGMNVPESEKTAAPAPRPMTQTEFFRGSDPKPAEGQQAPAQKQGGPAAKEEPKPKPKRSMLDMLLRRKKEERAAAADEYETEWRAGGDDPLTDAMRAGRSKIAAANEARDAEYRRGFAA